MWFSNVKERIFIAFFAYSTISFLVSVTSFLLFRQMEEVEKTASGVHHLYEETLKTLNLTKDFVLYETIKPTFFENKISSVLDAYRQQLVQVNNQKELLLGLKKTDEETARKVVELDSLLGNFDATFRAMIEKIQFRGFGDYGLIGTMQGFIEEVENTPNIDLEKVLLLRKYEKDFLIKNDSSFTRLLQIQTQEFITEVRNSPKFDQETKAKLAFLLNRYSRVFSEVVVLDFEIGYRSKTGLSKSLAECSSQIIALSSQINERTSQTKTEIIRKVQIILVIIVTVSVILTLLLSIAFRFIYEQ